MAETTKFSHELESVKFSYSKNDILVFITDGFFEAMDSENQSFGEENICSIIKSNATENAFSLMERLQRDIKNYTVGIQRDDATGIVIKALL